jgi:hypothetical protein
MWVYFFIMHPKNSVLLHGLCHRHILCRCTCRSVIAICAEVTDMPNCVQVKPLEDAGLQLCMCLQVSSFLKQNIRIAVLCPVTAVTTKIRCDQCA